MFKTWREEYRTNQAARRQIALERWEQEKRWREEDRAARQKAIAENSAELAVHNSNVKAAASVSYLTLVCHEDTWTFMAARAFGQWKPEWTQSVKPPSPPPGRQHGTNRRTSPLTRTCRKDGSRSSPTAQPGTGCSRCSSPATI